MNDPRIAIRRAERNIIDLLTSIEPGQERDDRVAEAIAELDAAKAQVPTPEDEAKANLKAKAEQAQRQAQVQSAEQTILTKAAANSPDHITPENVLTEAPDEVLRVIDTTPDVVIPRVVD